MADRTRTVPPPIRKAKDALIPLQDIALGETITARLELDHDKVQEYAEDMAKGDVFPAVILYQDENQMYYLVDGSHRVEAARTCGRTEILADVWSGTRRQALEYAMGANATHGMPRTNAVKRNAVLMYLADFPTNKPSTRTIAGVCKVSHMLVQNMLAELKAEKAAEKTARAKSVNIYKDDDTSDTVHPGIGPEEPLRDKRWIAEQQSTHHVVDTDEDTTTDGDMPEEQTAPGAPDATEAEEATAPAVDVEASYASFETWWDRAPDALRWKVWDLVRPWATQVGSKLKEGN
jgi:uncharacterized ParB-like nuclease family protein